MNQALLQQAIEAKAASRSLMVAGTDLKNRALSLIADALLLRKEEWLAANDEDMEAAKEAGISKAMLDRLRLTSARINGIMTDEYISFREPNTVTVSPTLKGGASL